MWNLCRGEVIFISDNKPSNNFDEYFKPGEWMPINKELMLLGIYACVVYSSMWAYSNGDRGYCCASVARLARDLELSVSTVKRAQARLEYFDLIEYVGGGGGLPVHYEVNSVYSLDSKKFKERIQKLGLAE